MALVLPTAGAEFRLSDSDKGLHLRHLRRRARRLHPVGRSRRPRRSPPRPRRVHGRQRPLRPPLRRVHLLPALVFCRAFAGLGVSGANAVVFTALRVPPVSHRGFHVVLLASGWMFGSVYSAFVGWLVVPNLGWRPFLVASAIPSAACIVLVITHMPESRDSSPRADEVTSGGDARRAAEANGRTSLFRRPPAAADADVADGRPRRHHRSRGGWTSLRRVTRVSRGRGVARFRGSRCRSGGTGCCCGSRNLLLAKGRRGAARDVCRKSDGGAGEPPGERRERVRDRSPGKKSDAGGVHGRRRCRRRCAAAPADKNAPVAAACAFTRPLRGDGTRSTRTAPNVSNHREVHRDGSFGGRRSIRFARGTATTGARTGARRRRSSCRGRHVGGVGGGDDDAAGDGGEGARGRARGRRRRRGFGRGRGASCDESNTFGRENRVGVESGVETAARAPTSRRDAPDSRVFMEDTLQATARRT